MAKCLKVAPVNNPPTAPVINPEKLLFLSFAVFIVKLELKSELTTGLSFPFVQGS